MKRAEMLLIVREELQRQLDDLWQRVQSLRKVAESSWPKIRQPD
jgi:hypothetical protein